MSTAINWQQINEIQKQASEKYQQGDLLSAIQLYQQVISAEPNQPDWVYGNAITILAKLEKAEEAIKLSKLALDYHTYSDEIYRAIGIAYDYQGMHEECTNNYLKAIQINDDQPKWLYIKLIVYLIEKDLLLEAIELVRNKVSKNKKYRDLIELINLPTNSTEKLVEYAQNHQSAKFYQELGNILLKNNKWSQAVNAYQNAIKQNPKLIHCYNGIAIGLSKLERWRESYEYYKKLLSIEPDFWQKEKLDYFSYHNYGDVLLVHQQWQEATNQYRQAIALNPSFFWSHYNLGVTLKDLEKWEEAVLSFEQAIKLNHNHSEAFYHLGEVYEELKQWKKAIDCFYQVINLNPEFPLVEVSLKRVIAKQKQQQKTVEIDNQIYFEYCEEGFNQKQKGNIAQAIDCYQSAIRLEPNFYLAYLKLGDLWTLDNQFEKAIASYQRAIELNADEVWSYNNIGEALVHLNQIDQAIDYYQQALAVNPSFSLSYVRLGEALEKEGLATQAVTQYKQALNIEPDFELAEQNLNRLLEAQSQSEAQTISDQLDQADQAQHEICFANGQQLQQQGLLNQAIEQYEQAIELEPSFTDSYLKLADVLVMQQKLDPAIANYQKVIELEPTQVWAYNNLAEALSHKGELDQAIAVYQQANQVNPDFALSFLRLGEALERKGELEQAIIAYQKVVDLNDPSIADAQQRLDVVVAKLEKQQAMEVAYQQAIKNIGTKVFGREHFYILDAHAGDPSGLGVVARRSSELGKLVDDSRGVVGKVLVPGRPDVYHKMVRPENINYIWTTFESTAIPQTWVDSINNYFAEVFVPHASILKIFKHSGVTRPISVLAQSYPERHRTRPLDKQPDKLILGILGCPTARKNFEKLIEAVQQLRQEQFNVELKIHCPWLVHHTQRAWGELPGITLSEGKLSNQEIDEWMSSIDAYIYPSSGEGWSFTPREAMSLGIPTIISDIAVHQELSDSGYYLTINSDQWEPAYYEFLKDNCGEWKVYAVEQIKQAIVEMANNYDHWQQQAERGQRWVKSSFAWKPIEQQMTAEIFPEHLMFCPTKDDQCGIHTYSLDLMGSLPQTKYVGSYEHIQTLLQRENIKSIHVQQEHGIIDNAELLFHVKHWNCKKQITLHSVIKEHQDPIFKEVISSFDDIFVLTQDAQSEIVGAKYLPHGTDLPITEPLPPMAERPFVASFGFIHEKKGYSYIAEATQKLGIGWRIVGKLKQELKTRVDTWENNINKFTHIEHFDGFFPEKQVFQLLSEARMLVFFYEDDNYLYQSGALLKAARCQRPVICSTATPMKQLHGCVHYVPYGDLEALTVGMKLILDNPDYGAMLVKAMNAYLSKNQWCVIAEKIS